MKVLLAGNHRHCEFDEAVVWLGKHTELAICDNLDGAVHRLCNHGHCPDIIVIAQSHPGQFSPQQIERVHCAAPLARLVALLGSWCEGEARSSQPWPGVYRVFWHEWVSKWKREFSATGNQVPRFLSLPRTATQSEQWLESDHKAPTKQTGLVAIHAANFVAFDALADACAADGYPTVWLSEVKEKFVREISAVIWDNDVWREADIERLAKVVAEYARSPVLVCQSFPRLDDLQRMQSIGVAEVLAKPFAIADLQSQLANLVDRHSNVKKVA